MPLCRAGKVLLAGRTSTGQRETIRRPHRALRLARAAHATTLASSISADTGARRSAQFARASRELCEGLTSSLDWRDVPEVTTPRPWGGTWPWYGLRSALLSAFPPTSPKPRAVPCTFAQSPPHLRKSTDRRGDAARGNISAARRLCEIGRRSRGAGPTRSGQITGALKPGENRR